MANTAQSIQARTNIEGGIGSAFYDGCDGQSRRFGALGTAVVKKENKHSETKRLENDSMGARVAHSGAL